MRDCFSPLEWGGGKRKPRMEIGNLIFHKYIIKLIDAGPLPLIIPAVENFSSTVFLPLYKQ